MKVGIITIIDNNNFGNRLQNYAVHIYLDKLNIYNETIINYDNNENTKKYIIKKYLKRFSFLKKHVKLYKFLNFNKKITFSNFIIDKSTSNLSIINNSYDAFIVGSDQVWNPNFNRLNRLDLLTFTNKKKIAFSASFGVSDISNFISDDIVNSLNNFDYISVRENSGKKIINSLLPNKKVDILIDPTLLLTADEWCKIECNPKRKVKKDFIFCYFLSGMSDNAKEKINAFANENNYEIVDIFDYNSPWFASGPSEFLWFEHNAKLICTDSFHSCVFAFLFNKPFIVFDRENNIVNMSSRIDNLLTVFELKERKYIGNNITDNYLNFDYSRGYEILKNERKKSEDFIKLALDLTNR